MGKYYIRIDGKTFGPYTAKVMMELGLTPDIMVTEGSKDAWQPASNFDFGQLAKQEILEKLNSTPANVAPDKAPTIEQEEGQSNTHIEKNSHPCPPPIPTDCNNKTESCSTTATTNSFPNSIAYNANLNEGLNSIGGKIIITPTQIIFHPHKLNFGNLQDRVYEISQISGYEKSSLTFMNIYFLNGSRITLVVWNKSEIIKQLEDRRASLIR